MLGARETAWAEQFCGFPAPATSLVQFFWQSNKYFAEPRRRNMGFLAWIVVGLIAGWLAGQVMKGGGYGVLVDIILGILGGVLGGWIFGMLGFWQGGGIIGSIIVAFIGAVILVWITRLLKKA
jgi:uncharacterized membrane protein YeaQ/YmgE (transglycosylase-associated protein family)